MSVAFLFRKLKKLMTRFTANQRGNISLIVGVAAIPLFIAGGAAIDYERAINAKTELQASLDSAVLYASAFNSTDYTVLTSASRPYLDSNYHDNADAAVKSFAITAGDATNKLRATGVVTMTTWFMSIAGIYTMDVKAESQAVYAGASSYTDVYVLVDNTSSMGLAATTADINAMQNLTGGCAFACHELDKPGTDYYALAKNNGVTMRIDSVRNAVKQVIQVAQQQAAKSTNQFRFTVYTFGNKMTAQGLTTVVNASTNLPGAITASNAIDLMTIDFPGQNNDMGTDFSKMLTSLSAAVPAQGSGSSWSTSNKIVFFISDGVNDSQMSLCNQLMSGSSRCQEPLDKTNCNSLKSNGVTLATIYTTYLAVTNNSWYNTYVGPYNPGPYSPSTNSQIAKGMQDCATSGYYQEVGPNDSLSNAISALFMKAIAARLTN